MGARLIFRRHALEQMRSRGIDADEVRSVIRTGETVEKDPDDEPYPSRLMLGYTVYGPVHVVVSEDEAGEAIFVVTAYRPSLVAWQPDWRTRRHR